MKQKFYHFMATIGLAFIAVAAYAQPTLQHLEFCAIDQRAGKYNSEIVATNCIEGFAKQEARAKAIRVAEDFARNGCTPDLVRDLAQATNICRREDFQARHKSPGSASREGSIINGRRAETTLAVDSTKGFCASTSVTQEPQRLASSGPRSCGAGPITWQPFKARAKVISACGYVCQNPN